RNLRRRRTFWRQRSSPVWYHLPPSETRRRPKCGDATPSSQILASLWEAWTGSVPSSCVARHCENPCGSWDPLWIRNWTWSSWAVTWCHAGPWSNACGPPKRMPQRRRSRAASLTCTTMASWRRWRFANGRCAASWHGPRPCSSSFLDTPV
ncbi:unnamed protein product, partial [Ixodes pacificus]